MNDFINAHEPTPEFRAALKRELQRAYRAEAQFDLPSRARARRFGIVIGIAAGAVMMLTIGLVLGAATGYASAENVGERQREAAEMRIATRRQFAVSRLSVARANYESVRREFEAGKVTRAALQNAKTEVDSMEATLARIDVEASGANAVAPPSGLSSLKTPIRNALTALTCGAVAATSQVPAGQSGIPIVNVTPVAAKTTTTLGAVLGVRELPDGRLLVNDAGRRQIKIFDSALANATVAQDSIAGTSNSYGPRAAQIAPYLGDSTMFMEILSRDVLILDRNGQVARALAPPMYPVPAAAALPSFGPQSFPFPMPRAIDHKGRLVGQSGTMVIAGNVADSALVLRADLETRQVDIIGAQHSPGGTNRNEPPEGGNRVVTTIRQPVPTEDSWGVLSDGTIAFVRGQDYHVDWILPDGTKSATTKLPFDWKRLSDEDKQKLIDSAKVVWDSLMAIRNARNAVPAVGRGGEPLSDGRTGRSSGGVTAPGQQGSIQRMMSVPLSEIPDYYPPINRNSAMPDRDGNLWILPTTSARSQKGELVYDVVNPKRGLFQRVRMPLGRSIAGFGKGGVIYLQSGDRTNGFYLERVKLADTK